MVNAMPASEYIRFFKSARMLFAEKRLTDIETASFPHYTENKQREDVMRSLSRAAKAFLYEGVTDFAKFAATMAEKMRQNG